MRAFWVGILVATALVVGGAGSAAVPPRLTIARADPATVQGRHFQPGEAIRVRLVMDDRSWTRSTRAGAAGGFIVAFAGVRLRYCAVPLSVSARGARSGTVVAKLPLPECAAP
ncbi:MAG TPA: hypothetical protein VFJ78_00290 [Gaiellaceae bacterium]|nr:hypothetical protein [Gaiellaceae bacterium]